MRHYKRNVVVGVLIDTYIAACGARKMMLAPTYEWADDWRAVTCEECLDVARWRECAHCGIKYTSRPWMRRHVRECESRRVLRQDWNG